jgi:outer membrane usher protein
MRESITKANSRSRASPRRRGGRRGGLPWQRALVLGLCSLALGLGPQGGAAQEAPPPPAQTQAGAPSESPDSVTMLADLVVNGQRQGSIEFVLEGQNRPFLPSAAVRRMLSGLVKPEIVAAVASRERLVAADELRIVGINVGFDPSELVLSVDVLPGAMSAVDLSARAERPAVAGERQLRSAAFGAVLDLSLDLDPRFYWTSYGKSFAPGITLGLVPAVRSLGLVAEGDVDLMYNDALSARVNGARLLRDFPSLGSRLALGIVDTSAVSFQSPNELLGLSFSREPSLPGPKGEQPRPIDEFVLERNADLSIEVNGIIARQLKLSPGSYRLSDLPLASGMNDVVVTIEEEGRPPRTIRLGLPFDAALAAPGQLDYSLVLGADRTKPTEPFGAAYASLGLGPYFELGADAEAGYGVALGGLSSLWASPLGSIGAATALSLPFSGGLPAPLSYGERLYWRLSLPGRRYAPRIGAAAEYLSGGFAPPRQDLEINPPSAVPVWAFSAQIGEALPGGLGGFSAFGDARLAGGSIDSYSFTLGTTAVVSSSTSLSLSGGMDWSLETGTIPRISLSLSVSQASRSSLQFSHDFVQSGDSVDLMMSSADAGRSSLEFSADGLVGYNLDHEIKLSGKSSTAYWNYSGSGRYYSAAGGGSTELDGYFSGSAALAFADGELTEANAFGDALAILAPAPSVNAEQVMLRPDGGTLTSSLDGRPTLIAGLLPYKNFVASVEMPQSSPERRPDPSSVEFTPTYRSITIIHVGVAASLTIRGRLVGETKEPRVDLSGDLLDAERKVLAFSGTFTDEEGVFECYDLNPGPIAIKWSDGSECELTVPEGEAGAFFDLGDVVARLPDTSGGAP